MGKSTYKYYLTAFLSQFNPMTIGHSLQQSLGHIDIRSEYKEGLPNVENYQNRVQYILPFAEEWFTASGGTTKTNSHSWSILTQRYAYDFVIVNEQGQSYKNEGKILEDYYCYNKEVLSPADGVVVEVQNTIKDYQGVGDNSIDWKTKDFRGNYVMIEHANDEFSFLVHFKQGSIKVQKGEAVNQGQVLGMCGNSGHSTEPHIHFHLQSKKEFWTAAGLPIRFNKISKRYKEDTQIVDHSFIEKDEYVKNVE